MASSQQQPLQSADIEPLSDLNLAKVFGKAAWAGRGAAVRGRGGRSRGRGAGMGKGREQGTVPRNAMVNETIPVAEIAELCLQHSELIPASLSASTMSIQGDRSLNLQASVQGNPHPVYFPCSGLLLWFISTYAVTCFTHQHRCSLVLLFVPVIPPCLTPLISDQLSLLLHVLKTVAPCSNVVGTFAQPPAPGSMSMPGIGTRHPSVSHS